VKFVYYNKTMTGSKYNESNESNQCNKCNKCNKCNQCNVGSRPEYKSFKELNEPHPLDLKYGWWATRLDRLEIARCDVRRVRFRPGWRRRGDRS
jgi:hypothetical protein